MMSELNSDINLQQRIDKFRKHHLLPSNFTPIAYNLWHELQQHRKVTKLCIKK